MTSTIPGHFFVAIGPDLQVVAWDRSRVRAKDKAIAGGVSYPWIVPANVLRPELLRIEDRK